MTRPWSGRPDAALLIALLLVSYVAASAYLPRFRDAGFRASFYQASFGPAVMQACGRGFVNPEVEAGTALDEFLAARVDALACDRLAPAIAARALEPYQGASLWLLRASAIVWSILGVSWPALDVIAGVLFSLAVGAAFVATRLLLGRTTGLIVTLLWATSPMHLGNVANLRDYAKAPFFAAMLAAAAIVVLARRPRDVVVVAAVFGLIQAIGFGMRTDVILNLAPFLVALFFVRPEPWRANLRIKFAAAAACLLVFAVAAWPVLSAYREGSALWHVSLLGLSTPFDAALNLRPAAYDFGHVYNDSYVAATVSAFSHRVRPGAPLPTFASPAYDALCAAYYGAIATTFPADVLSRMIGATLTVLNLPFTISYGYAPAGVTDAWLVSLAERRAQIMLTLSGAGPVVLMLVLMLLAARHLRAALTIGVLILAWTAYPFLQFQGRHVFHLELLTLGLLGALAALVVEWIRRPVAPELRVRALGQGAGLVLGTLSLIVGGLTLARAVQEPRARALLQSYASAPRQPLDLSREPGADGLVRLTPRVLEAPLPQGHAATFLVVEVTGNGESRQVPVAIKYDEREPALRLDFSRSRDVHVEAGGRAQVYFPAYAMYQNGQVLSRFQSIEVPQQDAERVRLYRLGGAEHWPLWLETIVEESTGQAPPLAQRLYLKLLVPERVWLKAVQWWPQLSSVG
jgi:hypothetical protein